MKNQTATWFIVVLAGLTLLFSVSYHTATAAAGDLSIIGQSFSVKEQAVLTPYPIDQPTSVEAETPEVRVLPPVGNNAGLVISASVLVLIIIGGIIISSRMKVKH